MYICICIFTFSGMRCLADRMFICCFPKSERCDNSVIGLSTKSLQTKSEISNCPKNGNRFGFKLLEVADDDNVEVEKEEEEVIVEEEELANSS